MKSFPLCLLLLIPMFAAAENVPGQFETYTLALSWEPAFCEGKPDASECRSQRPGRFDASSLALHGLWPDQRGDKDHAYGYCGVGEEQQKLDRAPTWCKLFEPPLSDATRVDLAVAMPGTASCLDQHEWARHGSCSGMAADDYFAFATALVQQVARTAFGRYLTAHAGQTVDTSDVLAVFERDFGSASKVALNCTDLRGSPALLEVRLRLPNPPKAAAELTAMALDAGAAGNCPASFLLDPVPADLPHLVPVSAR